LVPKPRASSWYRNAASLLVRPDGVEDRLVRIAQAGEARAIPANASSHDTGRIAVRAGRAVQRLDEPPLLLEPVIALLEQRGDRPAREEVAERRARVASCATAFAPFSQNSAGRRARAGRATRRPGQSKPRAWFSCASAATPRQPRPATTRASVEAIAARRPRPRGRPGSTLAHG
jgi:hypothetical protein